MWIKRISSINQRARFLLRGARAQSRKQQTRPPRTRRPKNFRQRPARQASRQRINFRNAAGNSDHLLAVAIIERRNHAPRQSEFHLRAQRGKVGSHGRVNCQRPKAYRNLRFLFAQRNSPPLPRDCQSPALSLWITQVFGGNSQTSAAQMRAGDFDSAAAIPSRSRGTGWPPLTWILFLNYVAAASSRAFRDEAGILVLSLVLLLNL